MTTCRGGHAYSGLGRLVRRHHVVADQRLGHRAHVVIVNGGNRPPDRHPRWRSTGVVGAVGEFPGRQLLAEIVRQFRLLHPDVKLTPVPVPITSVHSCLLEGVVDVMWGTAPSAPLQIETRPLVELELFAVVPVCHPLADAVQVDADDFAELPIAYDAASIQPNGRPRSSC